MQKRDMRTKRRKRQKTALLINNDTFSVIRFRSNLIEVLKDKGWRVETITPYDNEYSRDLEKLVDKAHWITMSRWLNPIKDLAMVSEFIVFCIKSKEYDMVHTMTLKPNFFLAQSPEQCLGKKQRL